MQKSDRRPWFIGAEVYRHSSYGHWHPLRVPRVSTVMDLSRALGWIDADRYLTSPRAKPAALTVWHHPDYIEALQRAERTQTISPEERAKYHIGTHANPVFPEIFRRPSTAAGGSWLAGELLKHGGTVYHPAGGTHHGLPGRANGFCYLNDPVLSILALRANGVRRIAYVDIDAHHPDGVEYAFHDDPDVLLISVHEERRWPFTGTLEDSGVGQVWNLPVPRALNDTEMAFARDRLIVPKVAAFAPEAIVLQCGADAVAEDPLARLNLSNNAHWAIVAALRPLAPRYLVLGGGGYNPWSVGRLWTGVWATLSGRVIPESLPTPATEVLEALTWQKGSKPQGPLPHWTKTLRDPPRDGPVRPDLEGRVESLLARQT
ncbi:MAG: acetoin utilization protein AcuC [Pseudomonadota bacterium]